MKSIQAILDEIDDTPVANPNRSNAQRGKKQSEATKAKRAAAISATCANRTPEEKARVHANYSASSKGRKLSEEAKKKCAISAKAAAARRKAAGFTYKYVTCPHCGYEGKETSTKRWHFGHCIFRNPSILQRFESAYREGPKTYQGKVSWNRTCAKYGIESRRMAHYITVGRNFILGKK